MRTVNCFWHCVIFDSSDFFNLSRMINDLSFDAMQIWNFDFACFERAILCCSQRTNVFDFASLTDQSNRQLTKRHRITVRCVVLLCVLSLFSKLLSIRWKLDSWIDCSNQKIANDRVDWMNKFGSFFSQ